MRRTAAAWEVTRCTLSRRKDGQDAPAKLKGGRGRERIGEKLSSVSKKGGGASFCFGKREKGALGRR